MIWLILCWCLVSAICYFILNNLGNASTVDNSSKKNANGGSKTMPSLANNSNSEWTNEVLAWMYSNFHKVPAPLEAWIRALNDAAKKINKPSECEIVFEGFRDHSQEKMPPKLSHIKVEYGPKDHLTLRTHVHLPCVCLRLVSSQRTSDRLIVSNFDAKIVDLRGEVECRIACIANQLYLMGCFNGRPEMDIELTSTETNTPEQVSLGLVEEKIRRCLLSAVTNINLTESVPANQNNPWRIEESQMMEGFNKNIYRSQNHSPNSLSNNYYSTPTALLVDPPFSSRAKSPIQQVPEVFKKLNETHLISPLTNTLPNKLRVKIIKANRLGRMLGNMDVQQPYVVIEMDEPAQKFTTSKGLNSNPYWEEAYNFDLTPASEEILFEVYESSGRLLAEDDNNFLGLSIVNFEEVRRSGEQIHTLKLQGRPYRKDNVSGDLTIQFDFFYDPTSVKAGKLVDTVTIKDSNGSEFRETVTTQRRALYDSHDRFNMPEITPTKTTTVVVKTVSQQLKEKPAIQSVHGSMENAIDPATQRILDEQFKNGEDGKMQQLEEKLKQATENVVHSVHFNGNEAPTIAERYSEDEVICASENGDERKSRDRSKKNNVTTGKRERSFFGELRDKLSGRRRSQKRSKSFDLNGAEIEEAVSLPPSRDPSRTRYQVSSNNGSRYYETQSVGAKSGESSKSLYQHSTLVLELEQDKQQKYFLIPPSMLTEPAAAKLMRKGKKLHIYNEHTFVAVKIRGGANCNVCQQRIRSSFSKQAYQCRDCKLVCHKSCHYKTDAFCTQSTVSKLQIAKDVDWPHFLSHYQLEEFISFDGV